MKTLGKYEVLEELGAGAMGKVFHGRDRVLQREVAIKTISTEDADVELKQRFYREARSCGRLSHPNIVTVFDLGEQQGTSYIAMEYLEGQDLRKFIDQKTFMPLEGKLQVMAEVAEGLAHAHDNRIVHRDIKPSNIFLLKSGRPKILDFGIARVHASQLTRVGNALGTPEYMSPEQIRGKETDMRSDIFSAAVVFFELLTNEHPFGDVDVPRRIIQDKPKSLRSLNPLVPEKLEDILNRALEKDPENRYQTSAEFAKVLRKLSYEILGECSRLVEKALENRQTILDSIGVLSKDELIAAGVDIGIVGKINPEMAKSTNANLHYLALSVLAKDLAQTAQIVANIRAEYEKQMQKVEEAPPKPPEPARTERGTPAPVNVEPEISADVEAVRKRIAALFDEDVDKCLAEIEILSPALANDSVIDSYWVRALSARSSQQAASMAAKAQTPAPVRAESQTLPNRPKPVSETRIDSATVVDRVPEPAIPADPVIPVTKPNKTLVFGGVAAGAIVFIVLAVVLGTRKPAPSPIEQPGPQPAVQQTEPAPAPVQPPPAAVSVPPIPAGAVGASRQPVQPARPQPTPAKPNTPVTSDFTADLAAARRAFGEENYDAAIALCDKILRAQPTNIEALQVRRRALDAKDLDRRLKGQ